MYRLRTHWLHVALGHKKELQQLKQEHQRTLDQKETEHMNEIREERDKHNQEISQLKQKQEVSDKGASEMESGIVREKLVTNEQLLSMQVLVLTVHSAP